MTDTDTIILAPAQIPASLKQRYGEGLQHCEDLRQAFDRAPKEIKDAETAENITRFIKQINARKAKMEEGRKAEVAVYIDGQRAVNDWFKPIIGTMDTHKTTLSRLLGVWQAEQDRLAREKQAAIAKEREAAAQAALEAARTEEEQEHAFTAASAADKAHEKIETIRTSTRTEAGTASMRRVWVGEIVDLDAVDLEALRPYLDKSALEKAVRGAVRAGARKIAGVDIFEQASAVVR
jgi:hypothetical protein